MDRQVSEALKVLGIPGGSDQEAVNNAYRRLARATHPDVSSDPDAAERFAALNAAYRLVSASLPQPGSVRPAYEHAASTPARTDLPRPVPPMFAGSPGRRPPIVAGPVVVRPARRTPGARDV
jgi:hypothetical protein